MMSCCDSLCISLQAFYLAYILSLFALFMNFYLKRWSPSPKSGVKSKLPKKVE